MSTDTPKQYSWSTDEQDFSGRLESRELAIADAIAHGGNFEVGFELWIGQAVEVEPSQLVNVDHIIDSIQCAASDIAGEAGEAYLSIVSPEQFEELEQLVSAWMQRVEPVAFSGIENVEKHNITADDLEPSNG